jgi:ferredoxin
MPTLTIDNRQVQVEAGATVLDAARKLGIEIPTLCFLEGCEPPTSCFVCVVKVKGRPGLIPSCATVATDGMEVESESEEVREARRMALELLLSDHLGDCVGPCHAVCPAHMDIPLMIRQIAAGNLRDAVITVKERIPLPAVLGRICPAPCEKGCRRAQHDAALSICLLKRHVGDADLASDTPWLPARKPTTGKRVAIVGAGPAGLSAAWYLLQEGHACILFDDHEKPGGMLRYGVPQDRLPGEALDGEIAVIARLGAQFCFSAAIGKVAELRGRYDAVLFAVGELKKGEAERLGLPASDHGIQADKQTLATPLPGVFAAGGAIRPQRMAVRSVADGKAVAVSIGQFLTGQPVTGERRLFSTHIGKLRDGEMAAFLEGASAAARVEPSGGLSQDIPPAGSNARGRVNEAGLAAPNERRQAASAYPPAGIGTRGREGGAGFLDSEARQEALRCLHCDCRKPVSCRLRRWADLYDASSGRYKTDRRTFEQHANHPDILYEPGKCIRCGLCVQICARAGEELGLTFIGRGFDVQVGVPFSRTLADGLQKVAAECAAACPTGALALRP